MASEAQFAFPLGQAQAPTTEGLPRSGWPEGAAEAWPAWRLGFLGCQLAFLATFA
jgi:hypothetical protein